MDGLSPAPWRSLVPRIRQNECTVIHLNNFHADKPTRIGARRLVRRCPTQADLRRVYELAWKLGCKGITVFRSGSKSEQVLAQPGEATAAAVFPEDADAGGCRVCAT
jgi:ribonucleotide reductase alpha subunit